MYSNGASACLTFVENSWPPSKNWQIYPSQHFYLLFEMATRNFLYFQFLVCYFSDSGSDTLLISTLSLLIGSFEHNMCWVKYVRQKWWRLTLAWKSRWAACIKRVNLRAILGNLGGTGSSPGSVSAHVKQVYLCTSVHILLYEVTWSKGTLRWWKCLRNQFPCFQE